MPKSWRAALPFLILMAALALFLALGGGGLVSVEGLRERHVELTAWTNANPWLSRLAFALATTALISLGFPSVAAPMFAGGLVFGWIWGGALALVACTLGSTIFFLASRQARAAALDTRAGALMERLARGMEKNAFFYLLCLRFLPIMPTVAATLVAAAARINLRSFLPATLLGLTPAAIIYTGIGAGAGAVLDEGGIVSIEGALLRPHFLAPIAALIVLSLAAIVFRARLAR